MFKGIGTLWEIPQRILKTFDNNCSAVRLLLKYVTPSTKNTSIRSQNCGPWTWAIGHVVGVHWETKTHLNVCPDTNQTIPRTRFRKKRWVQTDATITAIQAAVVEVLSKAWCSWEDNTGWTQGQWEACQWRIWVWRTVLSFSSRCQTQMGNEGSGTGNSLTSWRVVRLI